MLASTHVHGVGGQPDKSVTGHSQGLEPCSSGLKPHILTRAVHPAQLQEAVQRLVGEKARHHAPGSPPGPWPRRCFPAPHPRAPCRPRALRAQDQAADPEAATPHAEDALPAARGPEAALSPQPPPRPGATEGCLRPRRPLQQEGQDEEADVRKAAGPRDGHQKCACRTSVLGEPRCKARQTDSAKWGHVSGVCRSRSRRFAAASCVRGSGVTAHQV